MGLSRAKFTYISTPRTSPKSPPKHKTYSQVLKSPRHPSPVAVPSTAPPALSKEQQKCRHRALPDETEASTSQKDSTQDHLLIKIYEFMGSSKNILERLETAVGLGSDVEKPSEAFHVGSESRK